jgi:hypothetical protein
MTTAPNAMSRVTSVPIGTRSERTLPNSPIRGRSPRPDFPRRDLPAAVSHASLVSGCIGGDDAAYSDVARPLCRWGGRVFVFGLWSRRPVAISLDFRGSDPTKKATWSEPGGSRGDKAPTDVTSVLIGTRLDRTLDELGPGSFGGLAVCLWAWKGLDRSNKKAAGSRPGGERVTAGSNRLPLLYPSVPGWTGP